MNRIFVAAMLLLLASPIFGQDGQAQQPGGQGVAPNQVIIFEYPHFISPCGSYTLTEGRRHELVPSLGSCNNKVSSILIGEEVKIKVFRRTKFRGGLVLNIESSSEFNSFLDDAISSLIILPRSGGYGYKNYMPAGVLLSGSKTGENQFFPLPESRTSNKAEYRALSDDMNDRAERIFLYGDVRVTVWEHSNFHGDSRVFPGMGSDPLPDYILKKYLFKDKISSLLVEAVGEEAWQARGGASDATKHRAPSALKPHVGTIITPEQPADTDAQSPAPPAPEPPVTPDVGQEMPAGQPFELDTNRPGHDYKNFDLPHPEPELCRGACLDDPQCRAFTYVKPGVQGPNARCWLKKTVPPAEHAPCCISGVVR